MRDRSRRAQPLLSAGTADFDFPISTAGRLRFSRNLGANSVFMEDSIRFTPDTVRMLPPGRGGNVVQADIRPGGKVRRVMMSTAGFARIVTP